MRRLPALLLLAACRTPDPTPTEQARMTTEVQAQLSEATRSLDLSAEQQERMRPLLDETAERARKVRYRYRDLPDRPRNLRWVRNEMRDLYADLEQRIRPLLGPEQAEELRSLTTQWRDRALDEYRAGLR